MSNIKVIDTIHTDKSMDFIMNDIVNEKKKGNIILVATIERAIELKKRYKLANLTLFTDETKDEYGFTCTYSAEKMAKIGCRMVENHKNIITDRKFFEYISSKTKRLLLENKYTLIIEHCENVFNISELDPIDFGMLERAGIWNCSENGLVTVGEDKYLDKNGKFARELENTRCMQSYIFDSNHTISYIGKYMFSMFDSVILLTTFFDYSIMGYGTALDKVKYLHYRIEEGKMVEGREDYNEARNIVNNFVEVYKGKCNLVGESDDFLRQNWFKSDQYEEDREILGKNMYKYFRVITDSVSKDFMWTMDRKVDTAHTMAIVQNRLPKKCFLDYMDNHSDSMKDRGVLEFCADVRMPKTTEILFVNHGIRVNLNMFSVSILVQWILRSRAANGEHVKLYLPSQRMRNLLIRWENGEKL